jgi:hypothetical protein
MLGCPGGGEYVEIDSRGREELQYEELQDTADFQQLLQQPAALSEAEITSRLQAGVGCKTQTTGCCSRVVERWG